jgi:hypothetical protein
MEVGSRQNRGEESMRMGAALKITMRKPRLMPTEC